jgi:hypothetical protein
MPRDKEKCGLRFKAAIQPFLVCAQASEAVMTFHIRDREYDTSEVVELRLSRRDAGTENEPSKTLREHEARLQTEQLFTEPALDLTSTFVGGMITAHIHLIFRNGGAINFDVYNDRLAVDPQSERGYYLRPTFRKTIRTLS